MRGILYISMVLFIVIQLATVVKSSNIYLYYIRKGLSYTIKITAPYITFATYNAVIIVE